MKVVAFDEFGPASNLRVVEHRKPSCDSEEVLIKTRAVSVNPVDVKTRQGGALASKLRAHLPLVLGWDIAGDVVEVGSNVRDRFTEGDAVFGMICFPNPPNGYAEYVAAPASDITLVPTGISYEAAAASTLAALTAWQAFTHFGHLRSGDTVLIHAASGGVGHFAVQIAKHLGANVIATSSGRNKAFVESLGADQHLDYKSVNFEETLSDIDFCLETQGGKHFERTVKVMRRGGTIVNLPSGLEEDAKNAADTKKLQVNYFMNVFPSGNDMSELANLLGDGVITPHVSKVFDLSETASAHEQIETGRTVGKIVIRP
ncbi:NADP-dependent oxidoreductase [Endozoicomonas sp. G2_2]|uniref:NADP-dependent oxidoreductase n=1 Tax=Endozoicomonas sp. G2_2 TaxID=2821092 RepID=UPI001ADA1F23|nr:NADP-dependent oxidoreductase [Endozoicomonas sp. G2_2]MBO9471639.1 NADP-dependent oxidoreductase [Endozoicomonas sp. G2_2]